MKNLIAYIKWRGYNNFLFEFSLGRVVNIEGRKKFKQNVCKDQIQ